MNTLHSAVINAQRVGTHSAHFSNCYQLFCPVHIHQGYWEGGTSTKKTQQKFIVRLTGNAQLCASARLLPAVGLLLGKPHSSAFAQSTLDIQTLLRAKRATDPLVSGALGTSDQQRNYRIQNASRPAAVRGSGLLRLCNLQRSLLRREVL